MKNTLCERLLRFLAAASPIFLTTSAAMAASTALWIGNPGVTATTNWSDSANWSGAAGALGNNAIFGSTGVAGAAGTVTSAVDVNQHPATLAFTNASSQFHTVFIPSGVGLTNDGTLTVGGQAVNGYVTVVGMAGGGTLVQLGSATIGNNGSSSLDSGTTLDLSALSNFVFNSASGSLSLGSGNRSTAIMLLAASSNYITAANLNDNTASSSSSGSGNFTLGAGANVFNVGAFNIGAGRASSTVTFPAGSLGSLRVRGIGGTDNDRANLTLGNRNNGGGSGNTCTGTLNVNGNVVDMKLGNLSLGFSGSNPTGSAPGTGNLLFDSGVVDVSNIVMATSSGTTAGVQANGSITVGTNSTLGTNGVLIIGAGGLSMVNQAAASGPATGTLTVNGAMVSTSGNIRKTTTLGTANISITSGTLVLASATNTIGSVGNPIDNVTLADTHLTLPASSGTPAAVVGSLFINGSSDVINVSSVPGLGQFPLITYTALAGTLDFVAGTLPPGFQGYISNNVVGSSVDVVITNTLAKNDVWRGNVNGNWDTSTLNWISSGNPAAFQQGDLVAFDETLTGTPNVSLTTTLLPTSVLVDNSVHNYVFSGAGKISGNGSLTKQNSGTLTLAENGDDFAGGIIVNGGTLILDNANSAIGGGLTINSATVQIGNNDTLGALPGGTVGNNGTLIFKRTDNVPVSTPISGTGALTQNGSGTLTLSGANSFSGATTISNGKLALTGGGTLASSSGIVASGGTFDISALNQQVTLNALNMTNAAVTVAIGSSGTANISTLNLSVGGVANQINVTALPPIASYPVTFPVIQSGSPISGTFNFGVGTLPPATPSYAATTSLSADQTTVLLTVTAGPVGTRSAVVWSGADVPNLNTNWSDRLNWQLPGAPSFGENVFFGASGVQTISALSAPGGGSSALIFDFVNNIVDANYTISSLTYSNTGDTYHNTFIKSGDTLNMTNAGLSIGVFDSGTTATHGFVTLSGTGAAVNVSNTNGNFQVWLGDASGSQATLDMSALDKFSANVSRALVGSTINNVVNRPSGVVYLAKTNTITAGFQTTTTEAGTTTANAGIVVGDCNGNAGSPSFLYLGQNNTISTDTLGIGRQKAAGHLLFNPLYVNVAPYPTLTLQGATSSLVSLFDIGDGAGNTGTTTPFGDVNLQGGVVSISVDRINVGRASSGGTGANNSTGDLLFDAGTITVNTLNLGFQSTANVKFGTGTVGVNSNSTIGASAALVVRGSAILGNAAGGTGATTTSGTLGITNGTVFAYSIAPGTGSVSTVTLAGGKLVVTNAIGNPTAPLGTLTLAPLGTSDNSRSTLNVPVGYFSPGIMVANLNIDGLDTTTNVINIESVGPGAAVGAELPIIQYQTLTFTAGATFNIGLGTLPAGYAGYLTNDTTSSMIGLVLTSAIHPQPQITSLTQVGNALTISGTGGFANGPFHVLATADVAAPLSTWTSIGSGVFGPSGSFSFTTTIDPAKPQQFYIVQVP
jgi:autotransporter-associated beta strand protein